ncbi:MAG: hypothetical protein IKP23_05200 [Elusimicrobiaceae bacterium]|nr:hypothetical protein [Elusimicrobiaceae bacterium]
MIPNKIFQIVIEQVVEKTGKKFGRIIIHGPAEKITKDILNTLGKWSVAIICALTLKKAVDKIPNKNKKYSKSKDLSNIK